MKLAVMQLCSTLHPLAKCNWLSFDRLCTFILSIRFWLTLHLLRNGDICLCKLHFKALKQHLVLAFDFFWLTFAGFSAKYLNEIAIGMMSGKSIINQKLMPSLHTTLKWGHRKIKNKSNVVYNLFIASKCYSNHLPMSLLYYSEYKIHLFS